MEYKIRAAMASDAGSSVVYLFDKSIKDDTRVYLRIKSRRGTVWCEGIINNWNYRVRYDEDPRHQDDWRIPEEPERALTIGGWYRHLLDIDKRDNSHRLKNAKLDIQILKRSKWSLKRWWAAMRVSQQHPTSTNRLAMNLALLGAALGIVSLITPFL
jgi:hypothetical protein